jgi:hypothetical protein
MDVLGRAAIELVQKRACYLLNVEKGTNKPMKPMAVGGASDAKNASARGRFIETTN